MNQVGQDFIDKPSVQYVNAPPLTVKQNLFLSLLLRLEKEKYPDLTESYLTRTEMFLFYRGCNIKCAIPIVRFYLTISRLRGEILRVRKFLLDSFYYLNDLAIPVCFTVLTSWVEVLPKWDNLESKLYPSYYIYNTLFQTTSYFTSLSRYS